MMPQAIIPEVDPLPLPAPAALLWGLLLLTLFLHVLAMNAFLGGSLLALYARLRHATNEHARVFLQRFAYAAPVLAAATITLGVAPLLFLQVLYGRLFFVSSILMAWAWLAVVPTLIVAYYATYAVSYRARTGTLAQTWLYVMVAVLLLAIGFLYTNNMTLMLGAERFASMYETSGRGLHLNIADATVWPRYLHMVLGAIAVAGLVVCIAGMRAAASGHEAGRWAQRFGARASITATTVNVATGVWWTLVLPSDALIRLSGGNTVTTLVFAVSTIAGLVTLALLVYLGRANASLRLAWITAAAMTFTVATMLLVRDGVRAAALERLGLVPTAWVMTQWTPLVLFAVLLIAALATVAWMAFIFFRAGVVAKPTTAQRDRVATV